MGEKLLIIMSFSLLFTSCREVFETDLTQEQQALFVPVDGTIQTNMNVTFMWDNVEGATEYRLQIAYPDFTSPQIYVIDSVVTNSEITLELYPAQFEWRVRAQNHASYTDYSTPWSLTIDSSYDLTSQSLILYTPTDSYYTNSTANIFTWQDLYSANGYNFILKQGTNWTTGIELENANVTGATYTSTYSFVEGSYSWSVRGENLLPSYTNYATERILYIDQTAPATPIAILPDLATSGLLTDSSYLFNWTRPTDPGTVNAPLFDSIYVYADTNQLPISTYYSSAEDASTVLPSVAGTYYWKVVTFDDAGNISTNSNTNSFIVQ